MPGPRTLLPMVGGVALGALRTGRLAKGDTVLVTSGAGTTGHVAVQLARRQGAGTAIATAGSPAKLDFVRDLGADVVIDHTRPDWPARVREAVPGGVDLALDAVGGDMPHQTMGLLAPFGRAVVHGASGGDLTSVPVRSLFAMKAVAGFSLLALRAAGAARSRPGRGRPTGTGLTPPVPCPGTRTRW